MATTLIEIPQWGDWTLIEAIWFGAGLLALCVASLRVRALWLDYRYARALGAEDLHLLARGYLRREVLRIAQAVIVVSIGLYAGLQPPAIPGPARVSTVGLIITAGLIAIALLVAVQSSLDWHDRKVIRRILKGSNERT